MKQFTARTPLDVKLWVENTPHHRAYFEPYADDAGWTHFVLAGHGFRLRIPKALRERVVLKPGSHFDRRMYRWGGLSRRGDCLTKVLNGAR